MIRNLTKDTVLANHAADARSIFGRMRGMLRRNFSDTFDAIIFRRNNSIHMWFMHMPLDIVFLDEENRVLDVRHTLKPWRFAAKVGSKTVVELPAGKLAETNTEVGDQLELMPVLDL
jgi:uncharacterized membrane protein (UPF0127 family)